MKPSVVGAESLLKYSPILNISELQKTHRYNNLTSMNVFEFRNLLNSEDRKEKRKNFLRSLIKSVDTGANGTLDYIVKKGSGKNKTAKIKQ